MKKTLTSYILGGTLVSGVLALSACGDDVTKVTNVTNEVSGMEVAASAEDFAKCDSSAIGKMMFASDENAAYVCADSGWLPLSKNSEGSNGASCTAKMLSDSSGYKIVCGGDSVGVIKNGSEANGCSLTDNGDGTLVQVCGDDSTTIHIALCGDVPYKTDSEFCYENAVYAKCGDKIYSVGKDICQDEEVYRNKASVWNRMNPEIEYEIFTDVRDSQAYRTVKIGTQTWMAENLNFDYSAGNGSSCYGMLEEYCDRFGRAYTWSSAMDSAAVYGEAGMGCGFGVECEASGVVRGVCPEGFHLPDTTDWILLLDFVQEETQNEGSLKVLQALTSRDFSGTDDYGFGALIAGLNEEAPFYGYQLYGMFQTSSQDKDGYNDESWILVIANGEILLFDSHYSDRQVPVRCVKD